MWRSELGLEKPLLFSNPKKPSGTVFLSLPLLTWPSTSGLDSLSLSLSVCIAVEVVVVVFYSLPVPIFIFLFFFQNKSKTTSIIFFFMCVPLIISLSLLHSSQTQKKKKKKKKNKRIVGYCNDKRDKWGVGFQYSSSTIWDLPIPSLEALYMISTPSMLAPPTSIPLAMSIATPSPTMMTPWTTTPMPLSVLYFLPLLQFPFS